MHALSLKQPWATLLAHGLKTIEVRRWPTARRGRVLIHAARVSDERPEAWALVPPELRDAAQLVGGIVGEGDLTGCRAYRSPDTFAEDQSAHLNQPSWYEGPVLYGFTFANLRPLPFRPCSGWMRFFPVEDQGDKLPAGQQRIVPATPVGQGVAPSLLVSVRSVEEAETALAGGAAIVDVKEPRKGSLGQAPYKIIRAVCQQVAGRRPVSAALGELGELNLPLARTPLDYAKWGLAGLGGRAGWKEEWRVAESRLRRVAPGCRAVAVAYADWRQAQAPPPEEVCAFACESRCAAFLLDTWQKDGKTLLDWLPADEVVALCRTCRAAGVRVALAGSLGAVQILGLREARPDWFAVRGAVCPDGDRGGRLDVNAVRFLADVVARLAITPATPGN